MKKFEYLQRFNCSGNDLNELGQEGWELVALCTENLAQTFFFKREIVSEEQRKADFTQSVVAAAAESHPGELLWQIKQVKEVLGIGLKEAKELVDNYHHR